LQGRRGEAGVVGPPPKALPEMTASPKAVIEPLASLPGRRQENDVAGSQGSQPIVLSFA
jgi:hypothetical protein